MEVEPRRVCRSEGLEVPCKDRSHGQQDAPAHGVEDSMDLFVSKNESRVKVLAWCLVRIR
uniref:Uncharacterized protein n=1 Tax=Oryza brachyantha TaxID=4533 RepID=J3MYW2_ORYBR